MMEIAGIARIAEESQKDLKGRDNTDVVCIVDVQSLRNVFVVQGRKEAL